MTHTSLDNTLDLISLPTHSLLEPPSPAYTNVTVRRAFIVWMYCGQRNNFQHVCNYYHYLEALEDKLPAEARAMSRHHEFDMFSNQPPTSKYLTETFPNLYSHNHVEPAHIKKLESIKNEQCIFKLEGFNEIPRQKGATPQEIIEAGKIIRKYCKSHMIPLRRFLTEFKDFAFRCELKYTVNNVANYIKRKMLQAELDIINNYPTTFSFLEPTPIIFEHDEQRELIKPKPRKIGKVFGEKDVKLNESCAAFFKSFNAKYFENKSVSCSPLVDSNSFCNSFYDLSYDKIKSRSVESLLCKNFNVKSQDFLFLNSPLMNSDELTKLRRI